MDNEVRWFLRNGLGRVHQLRVSSASWNPRNVNDVASESVGGR